MRTNLKFAALAALGLGLVAASAHADQPAALDAVANMHKPGLHHMFTLETDLSQHNGLTTGAWDFDGWAGGDTNRLWLKSEGEITDGKTDKGELWALYGRHVATYWDAQVGVRADLKPDVPGGKAHTFLAAGMTGMAPYFFDTEAHVFLRDDGAISGRLRYENHWLITQRLIMRPRFEMNVNSRKDAVEGLGIGLTDASIGVQTRYEIRREFAPYVDLTYRQKFGKTADYARLRGEKPSDTRLSFGIRWMF
ncbi:copper resistance protein B [Asticcacaulis sp. EMRT-3]|uniref:copper resistance protein B n=1 Tax=Asticcacaulis sp. EMRT-3 TaxID=3040349 RepID=UPI0024AEAC76|nr:copper resistance protein B [Asticcacaulis sp. EMRT-3]MDI7774774.1 copper resistance protein B [Asticcacaulis sp. EMRT-3]